MCDTQELLLVTVPVWLYTNALNMYVQGVILSQIARAIWTEMYCDRLEGIEARWNEYLCGRLKFKTDVWSLPCILEGRTNKDKIDLIVQF